MHYIIPSNKGKATSLSLFLGFSVHIMLKFLFRRDPMAGQGKSSNQKLKTYLVMQYLLRNTDERHPALMQNIREYLREDCGIEAERRSIYRDIEDITRSFICWTDRVTMTIVLSLNRKRRWRRTKGRNSLSTVKPTAAAIMCAVTPTRYRHFSFLSCS